MSREFASSTIDNLALGMLLAAIAIVWVRTPGQALLLFAAQSVMLGAAAVSAGLAESSPHILVAGALTLAIKGIAAPVLLWVVLKRIPAGDEIDATLGRRMGVALAIALALVFAQSFDGYPFVAAIGAQRVLPTAVTVVVIGLQLMVTRRQAVSQALGFLVLENGMALAALTATYGMPLGVELGIFLDLFLVVLVIFVYTARMHLIFGSLDTDRLRSLRG